LVLTCATLSASAAYAPRAAQAQGPDELAAARTLFAEALRDQDARRHDVALEKFLRVQAVRDTAPIRYRIGMCQEALGRLAQAQASYQAAVDMAQVDRAQEDVGRAARARMDAVVKRVPRLSLAVTGRPVADIEVKVDDRVVPTAQLREPLLVDPGEHVLTASAPGSKTFRTVVSLPESGAVALTLPLDPLDGGPASLSPSASAAAVAGARDRSTGDGQRTAGLVTMVAGGALAGATVVVLLLRGAAISEVEAACPGGVCPLSRRPEIESSRDRAALLGPLGFGLGMGGLAAAATGAVLYFTAPRAAAPAVLVLPAASPSFAGAAMTARF